MIQEGSTTSCIFPELDISNLGEYLCSYVLFASFFPFFFQAQVSGCLCRFSSTGLQPPSGIAKHWPVTHLLRNCFYAPVLQHTVTDTDWNLFYHLGGNGPWIQKVDSVIHGPISPPTGCVVDQAHMVSLSTSLATTPDKDTCIYLEKMQLLKPQY